MNGMNSTETVKHTPGPWRLGSVPGDVWGADGYLVAALGTKPQEIANAYLIAAAAELLKELQSILDYPSVRHILRLNHRYESQCHCDLCDAEAAVGKARGE